MTNLTKKETVLLTPIQKVYDATRRIKEKADGEQRFALLVVFISMIKNQICRQRTKN